MASAWDAGPPPWPAPRRGPRGAGPTAGGRGRWRLALAALMGAVLGAMLATGLLLFASPQPRPLTGGTGTGGTVSVTVDDSFLSVALAQALHQQQLGTAVADLRVRTAPPDTIAVAARADLGLGLTAPVVLRLQPYVDAGHLALHVLTAQVGAVDLPAPLDARMELAFNDRLRALGDVRLSGPPRYVVHAVRVGRGELTVTLGPAGPGGAITTGG